MTFGAALRCQRPRAVPLFTRRFLATNTAQRNASTSQRPPKAIPQQSDKASKPKTKAPHNGAGLKRPAAPNRVRFPTSQTSYKPNGTFLTTRENAVFFRKTGIEPDNALKWKMSNPEAKTILRAAGINLYFCDKHVINPVDLTHLASDGSSRGPFCRAKYRRKLEKEPLWVHTAAFCGDSAVVRHTATQRVTAIVHKAAELLAERNPPIMVRGTVFAVFFNALKVARYPGETLLQQLVLCLETEMTKLDATADGFREHGRQTREPYHSSRLEAPDWNSLG